MSNLSYADMTGHKKAEAALRMVNTLTTQLYGVMDVAAIVKRTVRTIVGLDDSLQVTFYLHDNENGCLRLVEHHGFDAETVRKGASLPLKGSLAGLAVTEGTLQISDDLSQDLRAEPVVSALLGAGGPRTVIAIPLTCDDQVLGTLNLVYSSVRLFDATELSTFMSVGRTIGLSMSNANNLANLEYQARHDSLTGLPNRTFLQLECERLKKHMVDTQKRVALILFDIDGFKEINDTLGHHMGDQLLVSISQRVTQELQQKYLMFCRLGGDEFALIQVLDEGREQARRTTSELLALLEKPFELNGLTLEISASAGLAFYPEQAADSHELLRCADVAMYHAKHTHTRFAEYDSVYDEHSPERLSLMADLRQAVRDNQLVLHYQPKVGLHENRVSGFEALVRWHNCDAGRIVVMIWILLSTSRPEIWWTRLFRRR